MSKHWPRCQTTAPRSIYLLLGDEEGDRDRPFEELRAEVEDVQPDVGLMWCEDEVMRACAMYARVDLLNEVEADRDALRRKVDHLLSTDQSIIMDEDRKPRYYHARVVDGMRREIDELRETVARVAEERDALHEAAAVLEAERASLDTQLSDLRGQLEPTGLNTEFHDLRGQPA